MKKWTKELVLLTCQECWKEFYRDKYHIKKKIFCSQECATNSWNKKYLPWTQYAYLTILWFVEWVKNHWWRVLRCKCYCWKETQVPTWMRWSIKSCWCRKGKIHWMSRSYEYHSWNSMNNRCYCEKNESFKHYWGRGIKVLYKNFQEFFDDVWPIPWPEYSIDRIDVNKDYWPWNCRRATAKEQANNTRVNVRYKIWDEIHTISERADIFNYKYDKTKNYLKKHWERIFNN